MNSLINATNPESGSELVGRIDMIVTCRLFFCFQLCVCVLYIREHT